MHVNSKLHWKVFKHFLWYLKGTSHYGLCLQQSNDIHLSMYSNADSASAINDRVPTFSYLLFLGLNPIIWSSIKQSTTTCSSTEVKYKVVAKVLVETTWVKNLLLELFILLQKAPTIHSNNISVYIFMIISRFTTKWNT